MNSIKLDQSDLAITSTMLEFMQDSLAELQKLSAIGSDNYILSGCVVNGSSVSAGYVVVNGELLEFKAGNLSAYFLIRETETEVAIQEGSYTKITRYAEFGTGGGQIAWSSLIRIKNNEELEALIDDANDEIIRVEDESDTADTNLQGQIDALTTVVNGLFKTGMIMPHMGVTSPSGWLLCNGDIIPAGSEYDALKALLGSDNRPDLRNRAIVGAGLAYSVKDTQGNDNITLNEGQLPAHKHAKGTLAIDLDGNHNHYISGEIMQKDGTSTKEVAALDTRDDPSWGAYTKHTSSSGNHNHSVSGDTANAGSNNPIDIRNKSMAVNFIIKV